ncbi:hypothetical protein SEA_WILLIAMSTRONG_18 [Microbacterium phage WilliamStrong]|nr:hypothetical protein SEA_WILLIAMSTRONG_18 [Microbacterium phage WilliamStrong]
MAIIPVKNLTTEDILYGDRNTQYRWEVLEHSNGVDYLVGTLDGVSDGSLSWVQNAAVKGRGKMEVIDLDAAQPGMLRIGELALESARIRPVMTLNAQDKKGSYQDVWTETRRNWLLAPSPTVYSGSLWSGAAGLTTIPEAGWVGGALSAATTPYIFTSLSQRAYAAGEKITLSVRYRVTAVGGAATHITVRPHQRTGNIYYAADSVVRPIVVGQNEDVVIQWTTPVAIPAGNLDISILGATSNGALSSANIGFGLRATRAMIEDGWTNGSYLDGNTVSPVPYRRYRWLGTTGVSMSVAEVRAQQWVSTDETVIPEIPWGTFLLEKSSEEWEDTGRVWKLSMLDRTTVPSQDVVDQSYAVAAGTNILQEVRSILASSGEYMAIDQSVTLATRSGMVWEAGTSKLNIINDLLDAAGYNSLWMDGWGNFQATPRVLPADRSIEYELLTGVSRELVDGAKSIYGSEWTRERDSFKVPNKVIAIQAAGGEDDEALVGQWTNEDPTSPYSYPSRGRWIPEVLDSVECPEGTDAEIIAFLQARARATLIQMSAVQAEVKVEHLPIPVRVSDVLRFANTRAGIDARHVITRLDLETSPTGLMKSTLQEVISL